MQPSICIIVLWCPVTNKSRSVMTLDNAMAMLTQEGRGLGAARLRPGRRHHTDTALHGIRHWPEHAGLNSPENLCFSHFFSFDTALFV